MNISIRFAGGYNFKTPAAKLLLKNLNLVERFEQFYFFRCYF